MATEPGENGRPRHPVFEVGDTCLAPRVFDRRRARAVVEGMDPSRGTCLVTWTHPRHKRELACRYWKEGRSCKFSGPDCPFSHGVEVPLADLLLGNSQTENDKNNHGQKTPSVDDAPAPAATAAVDEKNEEAGRTLCDSAIRGNTNHKWLASLAAGSRVLARYHDRVWYEASVVEKDEGGQAAVTKGTEESSLVVIFKGFEDEGSVSLPVDFLHLASLDTGEAHGDNGGGGGSGGDKRNASRSCKEDEEESDLEDAWADAPDMIDASEERGSSFFPERVLGDGRGGSGKGGGSSIAGGIKGAEGGLCSDAYVFGDWEQHTKGFGSRMMSRMGYRRGEGLGKEKQGIARPVPIRVLPERRALDHLRVDGDLNNTFAGRESSGLRKAKKSKPGKASSAPPDEEPQKAMFDFLNVTIHASVKNRDASSAFAAPSSGGGGAGISSSRGRPSLLAARRRPVFDNNASSSARGDHPAAAAIGGDGKEWNNGADRPAGAGAKAKAKRAVDMSRSELRAHLVGAREAEAALATKVARLEETIQRNSERDPRTAAQAKQKLEEVKAQSREVKVSRDRAERALADKGKGRGKGGLFSF